jgi:hypothetical protein
MYLAGELKLGCELLIRGEVVKSVFMKTELGSIDMGPALGESVLNMWSESLSFTNSE